MSFITPDDFINGIIWPINSCTFVDAPYEDVLAKVQDVRTNISARKSIFVSVIYDTNEQLKITYEKSTKTLIELYKENPRELYVPEPIEVLEPLTDITYPFAGFLQLVSPEVVNIFTLSQILPLLPFVPPQPIVSLKVTQTVDNKAVICTRINHSAFDGEAMKYLFDGTTDLSYNKSFDVEQLQYVWDMLVPSGMMRNTPVANNILHKKKYSIVLPRKELMDLVPDGTNFSMTYQCFVLRFLLENVPEYFRMMM